MDGKLYLWWQFTYYGHVNITVKFVDASGDTVSECNITNKNECDTQVDLPEHEVSQCITTFLPSSRCNCSVSGKSQWVSNVTKGICRNSRHATLFFAQLFTVIMKYEEFSIGFERVRNNQVQNNSSSTVTSGTLTSRE